MSVLQTMHPKRRQAELLPEGKARDALLEKARQFESQISFNDELFEESRG
jgi:hypothetical protein